jgi:hypothetical protein
VYSLATVFTSEPRYVGIPADALTPAPVKQTVWAEAIRSAANSLAHCRIVSTPSNLSTVSSTATNSLCAHDSILVPSRAASAVMRPQQAQWKWLLALEQSHWKSIAALVFAESVFHLFEGTATEQAAVSGAISSPQLLQSM